MITERAAEQVGGMLGHLSNYMLILISCYPEEVAELAKNELLVRSIRGETDATRRLGVTP